MRVRLQEFARSAGTLVGLSAIAAVGLTASCFSERATATGPTVCSTNPCVVDIRDFSFEPAELRVTAGTTVRWVNGGAVAHTSTSDNAGWDSGSIAPGANFTRAFTATGRFPYHCEPHPTMRAAIVVE